MIPATLHMIWFGASIPYTHIIAIRSAIIKGGFKKVILHCDDDLSINPYWSELCEIPNFEIRSIDLERLLLKPLNGSTELLDLYNKISEPAGKSNILRIAILYDAGGVYFDMDTVTISNLDDLREKAGVFYGVERIIFPEFIRKNMTRIDYFILSQMRIKLREICRKTKKGWKHFRKIENFYYLAANNAILAAEAGHPFLEDMIYRMVNMPEDRQLVRYALGTNLLQETLKNNSDNSVLEMPPPYFYPIGPEISEHWFRVDSTATVRDLVQQETRVVHWYASVRIKDVIPTLTPQRIKELSGTMPYCELALPYIEKSNR